MNGSRLIVSGYGVRLGYRNGLFVVKEKNKVIAEAAPSMIEQIIIVTSGVSVSSKAIRTAIYHGIDVVFLDSRGLPIGRLYPPFINKTVDTRREQYLAYIDGRWMDIVRVLIKSKIMNQEHVIHNLEINTRSAEVRDERRRLLRYAERIDTIEYDYPESYRDKIRNIEAMAARTYWAAISVFVPKDIGFNGRDQDGIDAFNTILNYGYGILYTEAWKALVLAGLDPYAGYLHVDRSGKPVLVYDYVEPFRPVVVDYPLLKLLRRGWRPEIEGGLLSRKSRTKIVETIMKALLEKAQYHGDRITREQAMKRYARLIASYLRGETVIVQGPVER